MAWVTVGDDGWERDTDTGQMYNLETGASAIYQPQSGSWLSDIGGGDWNMFSNTDLLGAINDADVTEFANKFVADPTSMGYGGDWESIIGNTFSGVNKLSTDKTGVAGILDKLKAATGLSGSELGLSGVGILGALAALTSEPSTTTGSTSQDATSSQNTSGTTSQNQTGTSSQNSNQTQTGASTQAQTGTSAQSQTGTSAQSQTGTSTQAQTGTSAQSQTGTSVQNQTGTTAQTSETTLPQWYLDLVKSQATDATKLGGMDEFGKSLLDMDMGSYMNPFLSQVAEPVMRRLSEDQALQSQQNAASRVARGGFGSARADLVDQQMLERQALERENALTNMYSAAFGNAQTQAGNDLTRQFSEWQLLQKDPRDLASAQANILATLKPGQITTTAGATTGSTTGSTTSDMTGATTGTTAGTTTGTTAGTTTSDMTGATTGTTSGITTGSTIGSTTGGTSSDMTGATTGLTTGATTSDTDVTTTGTDPNKLGQMAGLTGTIWGMANPTGITKAPT